MGMTWQPNLRKSQDAHLDLIDMVPDETSLPKGGHPREQQHCLTHLSIPRSIKSPRTIATTKTPQKKGDQLINADDET